MIRINSDWKFRLYQPKIGVIENLIHIILDCVLLFSNQFKLNETKNVFRISLE